MVLSLTNMGAYAASSLGTLFSGGGSSSSITPIDLSSLVTPSSSISIPKTIPKMTPWDSSAPKTPTDKLASQTLSASSLFSGGLGTGAGSAIKDKNDKELFLLYNAVNKLKSLAETASTRSMNDTEKAKFTARLEKGIEEIEAQVKANPMTNAILMAGKKYVSHVSATLGQAKPKTFYTNALVNGDANTVPDQFTGDLVFDIKAASVAGDKTITIDLTQMGGQSRTVANVASFINTQLAAAGIESRFSANEVIKPSTIKGVEGQKQQRFEITIADLETISFIPPAGQTETAYMVSGAATKDKISTGLLTRIDASDTNSTEQVFQSELSAVKANANIRALRTDEDGNTYVLSDVGGTFAGLNNKTASDVALQKYDSNGRLVYTRALGAASKGQGFSIAVGNDGQVAIAGALDGNLNSDTVTNYGKDGFVAVFDIDGKDVFSAQTKSTGDDSAQSIAFDNSGNLLVLGQAQNGLAGTTAIGGQDLFIQSYSAEGSLNFTKSLGSSGTDKAVSLSVLGCSAFIAWNNETSGYISQINTNTGDVSAADIDVANFGKQRIDAFGINGNGEAIIAASSTTSGMADKVFGISFTSGLQTFSQDLAGQPIKAMSVNGNDIAIITEGSVNTSAANPVAVQAKLIAMSATDGSTKFSKEFLGEADKPLNVAISTNQSKTLQALGLPKGKLAFDTANELTDLTGLRAGDYFFVSTNGGTQRKVTIAENETMQSLGDKLSKYLSSSATVSTLSKNGGKYFSITPKNGAKIELSAGLGTANALKQLGLDEGVAIANPPANSTKTAPTIIALDLPQNIDLSSKETAKSLASALDSVLGRIRIGYRASSNDPTMVELRKTTSQKKTTQNSAAISAYNSQTAAMQEALARLGG